MSKKIYRLNRHPYQWAYVEAESEEDALAIGRAPSELRDNLDEWETEDQPSLEEVDEMPTDEVISPWRVWSRQPDGTIRRGDGPEERQAPAE